MVCWYSHQWIDKGKGGLGNQRTSGDYRNDNIKIGKNTVLVTWDLLTLQLQWNAVAENPQEIIIIKFEEKETYKYLGILEVDTIKQVEMKNKLRKNISGEPESYSRQNYLTETLSKE